MDELAKIIGETVSFDDEEFILPRIKQVVKLLKNNPFFERINFLLRNREIATRKVKNVFGEISCPNCIGTAFFVAGVGKFDYPYYAHRFEFDTGTGYNDCNEHIPIKMNISKRVPGAFVASYCSLIDGWHIGIYIGKVNEYSVAFSQQGHGGAFGVETVVHNYKRPEYYSARK